MTPSTGPSPISAAAPLSDTELAELESLLDGIPEPLEPLDISALDGYLCGVLLQPRPVPAEQWLRWVGDLDGRPLPGSVNAPRLAHLAQRRHAELDRAIARREWFDPWVFEVEDESLTPNELTLPWVAGFAAAMDHFGALMAMDDPGLIEPLAVLYAGFDPEDLEDAEELQAVIETLEPPSDLAEAVEDLVSSVLRLADVSRPRAAQARHPAGRRRKTLRLE